MRHLQLFLKLAAPIFFLVGALHLALGANADVLLGARLSLETLADPALDSQNRFYGVAFALYGLLLWLSATDMDRYGPVFLCTIWTFFAAGLARLVSIAVQGPAALPVAVLLLSELLLPPLLALWYRRVRAV